jgi:hypothetical protein
MNAITNFMDAQQALAFLIPQLTHIEREVYRIRYPAIRYPSIIPVATEGNEWMPSVTYFSMDGVGQAGWFNANSGDVANADIMRAKYETGVEMAAIGYRYNTEELMQAQMLGVNLTAEKAKVARRVAEEFIDQSALFGNAEKGFVGLVNNPEVTVTPIPANGGGNSSLWVNKTPQQILADFNAALTGIYTSTNTVELADTVLVPVADYTQIATTPFNAYSEKTILAYIREHNVYTAETGMQLNVRSVRGLDTSGVGGVGRIIAYRKDPEVLKLHLPMPFRFLPNPFQRGPMVWEIPGIFRFGGTDIRLPKAVVYLDGSC